VTVGFAPWDRLRRFFTERIWDVRPADLPRGKSLLYRTSRIAFTAGKALLGNRLTVRAAALTYFSVLSLVPLLAFAFSVLKGFGAYRTFVEGTVRPYLKETFAPNPALHGAIDKILEFVDQTDVSRLGAVGVVFLVYTSVSLISNVEQALNAIFDAQKTRPFLRQVTDYVTLLVISPLLLFAATTVSTATQSSGFVQFLRTRLGLGPMIDFSLGLAPIVVIAFALFAMYMILPNVRTRVGSALLGAAIAALLWQGALVLHVQLQMGVARYNALYSVLGAIPIFLVWTYLSWVIVLLGATIAATHQNDQLVRQRLRGKRADQALRETIAIAAAARLARDFVEGKPRPTAADLAEALEVPPPVLDEVLEALVRAGVVARTVAGREIAYLPGKDLDQVRATDVRDALRRDPEARDVRASVERQLGPDLRRVLRAAEEERRSSPYNATLRELAAVAPDGPPARAGEAAARAAQDGDGADVLDAKQPDGPV
jgi:membrane protein